MYEHEGEQYGRLTILYTVMSRVGVKNRLKAFCLCSCGRYTSTAYTYIVNGYSCSCGCKRDDAAKKTFKNNQFGRTHGKHATRTYRIWNNMKRRTTCKTNKDYANYGGRGIKLCDRWQDFSTFLADMGECPKDYTIDRIDYDGNYEPGNCRWATWEEQAWNKRNNVRLEYNGKIYNLHELFQEFKIPAVVIYNRLYCYHWSLDKALHTPIRPHKTKEKYNETKN